MIWCRKNYSFSIHKGITEETQEFEMEVISEENPCHNRVRRLFYKEGSEEATKHKNTKQPVSCKIISKSEIVFRRF